MGATMTIFTGRSLWETPAKAGALTWVIPAEGSACETISTVVAARSGPRSRKVATPIRRARGIPEARARTATHEQELLIPGSRTGKQLGQRMLVVQAAPN